MDPQKRRVEWAKYGTRPWFNNMWITIQTVAFSIAANMGRRDIPALGRIDRRIRLLLRLR